MKIYVGNLAPDVTEDDLSEAFGAFGQVVSASVIKDKFGGGSRGYGFVDMSSRDEGKSAIEGMKDKELKGRVVRVDEARPRKDRRRGGGGPGGGRRPRRNYGGGGGGSC